MMNFKYQKYLERLFVQCPPSDYTSQERIAFRFVFGPTHKNYKNNFLPVLILKPARQTGRRFKKDSSKCQGYALSFFESLTNIKQRYLELKKDNPNICEQIGTHIAQGLIEKEDGLVSPIDKKGHFSLHEFEGTQLENKFRIICPLE
jgi:hypothetical protein